MTFSCNKNIYYIIIDVIFSGKHKIKQYPFNLKLSLSVNLIFKCILDYSKSQINCFLAFSDEDDFLEKDTYSQFSYPFPQLEDLEWDYEAFLKKIYRKV